MPPNQQCQSTEGKNLLDYYTAYYFYYYFFEFLFNWRFRSYPRLSGFTRREPLVIILGVDFSEMILQLTGYAAAVMSGADDLRLFSKLLFVAENRTYHFQGEDTQDMET